MNILKLLPLPTLPLLLVVTSCASRHKPAVVVHPAASPPAHVDAVRFGEVVRPYHVGRYVDPNHPEVMHEQHSFYRVEATARWNLKPPANTALRPFNPPVDATYSPAPTNDAILAELNQQKAVTERVTREAGNLVRSYGELQQVIKDMTVVAQNHKWMGGRIGDTERKLQELEREIARLSAGTTLPESTNGIGNNNSTPISVSVPMRPPPAFPISDGHNPLPVEPTVRTNQPSMVR